MTQHLILAALAATLIICVAMHDMEERAFVTWLNVLFLFWCGGGIAAFAAFRVLT